MSKLPPKRAATPPKRSTKKTAAKKAAPEKEAAAPKKAAPVKNPAPAKKSSAKVAAKKSTPKKSSAKATSKKPATENKVPRVKALTCRALNDEQLQVWTLIHTLQVIMPANVGKERIELRYVDDRAQVYLNEQVGVPCRGAYTQEAEVKQILAHVKKNVPKDCLPKKWVRRCHPED